MQLISCSPKLRIDIRAAKPNYTAQGHITEPDKELFVQFYPGGTVPDHAKALADQLPGLWQGVGRDENPYETRLGWWDSYAAQADYDWTDEERQTVEKRMLQIGDPNVMLVEELKVAAPYAKYDAHRKTQGKRTLEHVIADILQTYGIAGFDVGQAVAYEKQNLNDAKVIAALELLEVEDSPTELEEVIRA